VPVSVDLTPAAESQLGARLSTRRTELVIALLIVCIGAWVGVRAVEKFRLAGGAQFQD
jgi:hypothetical protein